MDQVAITLDSTALEANLRAEQLGHVLHLRVRRTASSSCAESELLSPSHNPSREDNGLSLELSWQANWGNSGGLGEHRVLPSRF